MSRVVLDEVSKVYAGGVVALDRVSLTVEDGELVALVGPSGSGKTTLLRVIAGLERAGSGKVLIGGREADRMPPEKRDVALIFDSPALYPHLTVHGNLAFGLRVRRTPRQEIDRRVYRIAALLGIRDLLGRKPQGLSGGERQRVSLGRALVREPQVLLLDEPLKSLDAPLRTRMRREIRRLQSELSLTTIYVTHDQGEAIALGSRLVVLDRGRVQQSGTAAELCRRPANRFVAGFLGSPPMSFLRGRVRRDGERTFFETGESRLRLPANLAGPLAGMDGRTLLLGIRHEHVQLRSPGDTRRSSETIAVRVDGTEPLESARLALLSTRDGQELSARWAAGVELSEDAEAAVALDLGEAHLFDPEQDGRNVAVE